jgi:hypothetical protein
MENPEKIKQPSPEEILKKTGHIREIIGPKSSDLLSYERKLIEDQLKQALTKIEAPEIVKELLFKTLINYLKAPTIRDDFDDDNKRDELENSFYETDREVYDFYRSNRLRTTNIRNVLQMIGQFNLESDIEDPEVLNYEEHVWSLVSEEDKDGNQDRDNFRKYESLDEQKKIAVTEDVARLAHKIADWIIERSKKEH